MGCDAYVLCNCFRDGKTTQPPVPRDEIYFDDESGSYDVKENPNLSKEENDERQHLFWKWERHCCEHENMEYVDERVGNFDMLVRLEAFINLLPVEKYPNMHVLLETMRQEPFSAQKCALILPEILSIREDFPFIEKWYLEDSQTHQLIYECFRDYFDDFLDWDDSYELKLDTNGLFVHNYKTKEELFRAKRVRQTLLKDKPGYALLENLDKPDKQVIIKAMSGFHCGEEMHYPTVFEFKKGELDYGDLQYTLYALITLFQASIETGNSVYWC